jgi:hypothetical protein
MPGRKTTRLVASGEKVAARVGIFLPTRGYQQAKATALQALMFFYLTVVIFGYLVPTVNGELIHGINLSSFLMLSKSNARWLMADPMVNAEACIKLADSYQLLLKQMLDVNS